MGEAFAFHPVKVNRDVAPAVTEPILCSRAFHCKPLAEDLRIERLGYCYEGFGLTITLAMDFVWTSSFLENQAERPVVDKPVDGAHLLPVLPLIASEEGSGLRECEF